MLQSHFQGRISALRKLSAEANFYWPFFFSARRFLNVDFRKLVPLKERTTQLPFLAWYSFKGALLRPVWSSLGGVLLPPLPPRATPPSAPRPSLWPHPAPYQLPRRRHGWKLRTLVAVLKHALLSIFPRKNVKNYTAPVLVDFRYHDAVRIRFVRLPDGLKVAGNEHHFC